MWAHFMLWEPFIGPCLKAMRTLIIRPTQGYRNTASLSYPDTWMRKPDCLHLPYRAPLSRVPNAVKEQHQHGCEGPEPENPGRWSSKLIWHRRRVCTVDEWQTYDSSWGEKSLLIALKIPAPSHTLPPSLSTHTSRYLYRIHCMGVGKSRVNRA